MLRPPVVASTRLPRPDNPSELARTLRCPRYWRRSLRTNTLRLLDFPPSHQSDETLPSLGRPRESALSCRRMLQSTGVMSFFAEARVERARTRKHLGSVAAVTATRLPLEVLHCCGFSNLGRHHAVNSGAMTNSDLTVSVYLSTSPRTRPSLPNNRSSGVEELERLLSRPMHPDDPIPPWRNSFSSSPFASGSSTPDCRGPIDVDFLGSPRPRRPPGQ